MVVVVVSFLPSGEGVPLDDDTAVLGTLELLGAAARLCAFGVRGMTRAEKYAGKLARLLFFLARSRSKPP